MRDHRIRIAQRGAGRVCTCPRGRLRARQWAVTVTGGLMLALSVGASSARAEVLELDRALGIAMDRSPTILQARHGLEISRRNLQAQRAALKSRFGLTVTPYEFARNRVFNDLVSGYNTQEQTHVGARFTIQQPIERTDGTLSVVQTLDWREASSSFAGGGARKNYSNALFLAYSQPLFTYNRTRQNLERLELALENARLGYALQRLQIESQVTRLFLNLYLRQRNVDIAREELRNAAERFDIIESKVRAGITAREELLQADLTRANTRAGLESAQLEYANALDDFRVLLGLPFDLDLEVTADVRKELVEVNLARATEHGLEHRMELRQAGIAVRNAMQDLIATDAQNEFRGTVDLTFGLTGTDEDFADVYSDATRNQRVTVQLNVPLFDWGEKRHRMAAAQRAVDRSALSADEERQRIVAEIRQAHRTLQSQKTQIEIAEKNVITARQTYEINLERYRNGDLSSKDIADYQTQLSREQINEVGALIQYRLALLDLKIRTLYDFARDQPIAGPDDDSIDADDNADPRDGRTRGGEETNR